MKIHDFNYFNTNNINARTSVDQGKSEDLDIDLRIDRGSPDFNIQRTNESDCCSNTCVSCFTCKC